MAHLLAAAVKELYPDAKPTIGPAIDTGFYYDFADLKINEDDIKKIEKKMHELLPAWKEMKEDESFAAKNAADAKKRYTNNPFKKEMIDELASEGKKITFYKAGNFSDLCRGGHVKNPSKEISADAFTLTHTAGAYWRGDENRPMLTRIYGAAFATKKELGAYLKQRVEAEALDHKKLGRELGLFVFSDLVGAGLPLFTPKGAVLFRTLSEFSEKLKREIGFTEVHIPHIAKLDLYKVSGHAEKFKDDIFYIKGHDSEFVLKPMNCPHHIQIYASSPKSYRELPVRLFETTTTYRDEQSGELGGLTRVRSITMDDSHIFTRPDQIEEEFSRIIGQIKKVVKAFMINDYQIRLSLRDEKNKSAYLGTDVIWKEAEKTMEKILKDSKMNYYTAGGEAAFYGPKMDFIIKDSLGRDWQISTIQLDLNLPARFKLTYADKDGGAKQPFMIHSAFLGSVERFMGIMIEHYGGAFPVWLAPEQVWILPISDKFNSYGKTVKKELNAAGIRVVLHDESESLGKKIREGQLQKIPYLLIVGEKEKRGGTVAVRDRKKGDVGAMKTDGFAKKITAEIESKK